MNELLEKVKRGLMITGNQFDAALEDYITDVQFYLIAAGVDPARVGSAECLGVIRRGVSDLWNNDSGNVEFSPYFYDKVTQLVLMGDVENV